MFRLISDYSNQAEKINTHVEIAKQLVNNHRPTKNKENDIKNTNKTLDELNKSLKIIKSFQSKSKKTPLLEEYEKATQEFLINLESNYGYVLFFCIRLNQVLADQYKHLYVTASKSKKQVFIIQSFQYMEIASSLFYQNEGLLKKHHKNDAASLLQTELEGMHAEIESYYQPYASLDEKNKLLKQARETKDKEKAYQLFQQIITNAKQNNDIVLQFTAFFEQGLLYGDAYKQIDNNCFGINEVMFYQDYFEKPIAAYKEAAKLLPEVIKINIPLAKRYGDTLCHDFLAIAEYLYKISSYPPLENNFIIRNQLLQTAFELIQCGEKLPINHEKHEKRYADVKLIIVKALVPVKTEIKKKEKEEQNKKNGVESKKQLFKEYEEKFNDILNQFKKDKKLLPQKQPSHQTIPDASSEQPEKIEEKKTENELTLQEENQETPIYIGTTWAPFCKPSNNKITLETLLELLKTAEDSSDLLEQIRVHINIAEYHRILALRHPKSSSPITELEITKNHLSKATSLLSLAAHLNNNDSLEQIKSCVHIILTHTETLLEKAIKRHKTAIEQLIQAGKAAKKHIIEKFGIAGWKTNKPLTQQSTHTKNREKGKELLSKLYKINDEVHHLSDRLNQENKKNSTQEKIYNRYRLFKNKSFDSFFERSRSSSTEERPAIKRSNSFG